MNNATTKLTARLNALTADLDSCLADEVVRISDSGLLQVSMSSNSHYWQDQGHIVAKSEYLAMEIAKCKKAIAFFG